MVRVIREFLKIPETVFTTQVIWQLAPHQPTLNLILIFQEILDIWHLTFDIWQLAPHPLTLTLILIFQEILDICGVLNVNAHELPVTPTPTQVIIPDYNWEWGIFRIYLNKIDIVKWKDVLHYHVEKVIIPDYSWSWEGRTGHAIA